MKYYLFAKAMAHLTADALMELCVSLGLDGVTALIREGYWTTEGALERELPCFVHRAEEHGLEVRYADTSFDMRRPEDWERHLPVLRDCGIKQFRLGYMAKSSFAHPRDMAPQGRLCAQRTALLAQRYDMQAVIQIHGDQYPHCATAAWPMVQGLDPQYIGIKLDPGNNRHQEGYERYDYQIPLLGEYIAALGAKDAAACRTGDAGNARKGWETAFVPADEGQSEYPLIFSELIKTGFDGAVILMPFYETACFERLCEGLKREIAYLKAAECAAGKGII